MEHMKVSDEWLYRYMPMTDASIIQELERQVDINYKFSNRFERKMSRLIRKEAHQKVGVVYAILKRAAVFVIGLIGAAFIFTMSVDAYRIKFFETIRTLWEDSIIHSFFSDKETGKIQISVPTYIPKGYREIERIESEISLIIIYENGIGEQIVWEQILVLDGGSIVLDSEYDAKETKQINGSVATVFLYSDGYVMAYYEYEECVYYLTADRLNADDVYRIIESMNTH